jgi:lipopolysaccharide export system permease protein
MLMTRYLFKNLLNVTLFVVLTLTLVIWLAQSLKLLELVANSDAPPGMFLRLVALTLPKFLEIILPLSLVIAVLFTYNKLIMDNEIIVLRASGVDQYTLARPAIVLAVTASLLITLITTWVSPKCFAEVQELRQTIKTQYSAFLLREGVFNTFGRDLTVYLRERRENGDMMGLMIHDSREKNKPPVTITAKKGRVEMEGDVPNIVVFEGMRQQLDADSGNLSKLYFSRYTIEIKGLEGVVQEHWRDASERTLPELLNPDLANKRDIDSRNAFLAEAVNRVVAPWNALSFTMIALATVLLGPFNRRGQNIKIMMAVVFIVLAQTLSLALGNISKKHLGSLPFIYISTVVPIMLGFYLMHLRGEQWLMAMLRRWNAFSNRASRGASA